MGDFSWTTLGLVVAVTAAMVLLTWIFVILRQDRSQDQAELLRSDQAVDSALIPLLEAYETAIAEPNDDHLFTVEQRLKDLLLVVVSFSEADHDFKTLPKSLELALKNLETLPEEEESVRQRQLEQDCAQIRLCHMRIERIIARSSS